MPSSECSSSDSISIKTGKALAVLNLMLASCWTNIQWVELSLLIKDTSVHPMFTLNCIVHKYRGLRWTVPTPDNITAKALT